MGFPPAPPPPRLRNMDGSGAPPRPKKALAGSPKTPWPCSALLLVFGTSALECQTDFGPATTSSAREEQKNAPPGAGRAGAGRPSRASGLRIKAWPPSLNPKSSRSALRRIAARLKYLRVGEKNKKNRGSTKGLRFLWASLLVRQELVAACALSKIVSTPQLPKGPLRP